MTTVHRPPAPSPRIQREEDLVAEMHDQSVIEMHRRDRQAHKRLGTMVLTGEQLATALGIPANMEIVDIRHEPARQVVSLTVRGPQLKPWSPVGCEPPVVQLPQDGPIWSPGTSYLDPDYRNQVAE